MADLIKIFYDIGFTFRNEFTLNQIETKKVDKVLCFGVEDKSLTLFDSVEIKDKLYLRVLSANGGNLYPIFYLKKHKKLNKADIDKPLTLSMGNMKKYVNEERLDEIVCFFKKIDLNFLNKNSNQYTSINNCYFALFDKNPNYGGKSISQLFPSVMDNFEKQCIKDTGLKQKGECYLHGVVDEIGYDATLPFTSVNELSSVLAKKTKFRLLPLGKNATKYISIGFEKVFKDNVHKNFKFNIFGSNYILLPTIFIENKRQIYNEIIETSFDQNENKDFNLQSKNNLERKLERLIEKIEVKGLSESIFFTFLFYKQNNNEIVLYQTIEDVAPSRISKASKLIKRMDIECDYLKIQDRDEDVLLIRDYINNGIVLAKLIFGKEKIKFKKNLYNIIFNKIMFGSNNKNNRKRFLSKIILGYYKDDINFKKHQRFIDFLDELDALNFKSFKLYKEGGVKMNYTNLEILFNDKFTNVDLLKNLKAQEFYTVGAFARLVIDWQYKENSETVAKYLDSLGIISLNNIDKIFRKIYNGSRKYRMYGEKYDFLLSKYSEIKSKIKLSDKISTDMANIAFIMGAIDYKQFNKSNNQKEENND